LLVQARSDELRRAADKQRGARAQRSRPPQFPAERAVTLRFGFPDDAQALARLATLDSARPLAGPVLLAEVGGELWAALSLADGAVVADPFHPTSALVELLNARARQLSEAGAGAGRWSARGRGRLASLAWGPRLRN
jgi:hypothetical protein